jgi:hypothetical protein
MCKSILIRVLTLTPDENFSRFKNFGEDVWRYCRNSADAVVTLEEIDRSEDQLTLSSIPARKARRVQKDLLAIAERHYFSGEIVSVEIE